MNLTPDELLCLSKDCIEYHRAVVRNDKAGQKRNEVQILKLMTQNMPKNDKFMADVKYLLEPKVNSIDAEWLYNIEQIIDNHTIDDIHHNAIVHITDLEEGSYMFKCEACNTVIIVDQQNKWAWSLNAENGYEADRYNHKETFVRECND